jgi:aspartate/methionine/tyrosine aminotransferase
MTFKRMLIEEWFDTYQFKKDFDIGESGVKFMKFGDLDINLDQLDLRYGYHLGAPELREQIASLTPGITSAQVGVTTGAGESIFAVTAALVGPGEHVIVETPNFPSLYEVPTSLEREVSFFPLQFEDQFKPDLDRLKTLIQPNTKMIVLTHPNNPAGSVITSQELEQLVALAEENDVYLLLDETYRELSFSEPPPLAASLSPKAISITSMSKTYGLPGIRVGWVVGNQEVIDGVCAVREQVTICNPSISEAIALHVLMRKDWMMAEIRRKVQDNYAVMKNWLDKRADLEWVEPQSGVVAFPRLAEDTAADSLCRLLVEKYRTFVVPGYCFGMPRYFRMGFGGSKEELVSGLDCLDKALSDWRENGVS